MYIEKSTCSERLIVENAMYALMGELDIQQQEIGALWEEYFSAREQKPIDQLTAMEIGRRLRVVSNIIFDILLEYSLYVGDKEFRGYGPHMEGLKVASLALEVNEADERAADLWRTAKNKGDLEKADDIDKARKAAGAMSDELALPLLRSLTFEDGR